MPGPEHAKELPIEVRCREPQGYPKAGCELTWSPPEEARFPQRYRASSERRRQAGQWASGGGGALRFHLRHAFLKLASEMGNDAELALDEHELSAVMHFVFLRAEEAFEACFLCFAIGFSDHLREKFGS